MNVRPSPPRLLAPLLIAIGALTVLLAAAGPAAASPTTGPGIEPITPADGALVQGTEEPIKATFSCPSFVYEPEVVEEIEEVEEEAEEVEEETEGGEEEGEENEEAEPTPPPPAPSPVIRFETEPPVLGGAEEYGVHFSTSPDVDSSGRLGTTGFGESGEGASEAIKGSQALCSTELELPTTPIPATLYSGKIYWQVYRSSEVPADKVEVGPVRSFVVYPHVEEPELAFREQAFVGYLTKVGFYYESELGGAVVQLQEFENGGWSTIAEAPGSNKGENAFFIKPSRAGHHLFRAYVPTSNPVLGTEPVVKAIRPLTKTRVTGAADDGAYVAAGAKEREESPVLLSVGDDGRILRNLTLEVETVCKGPTKPQDVTIEIPAHLEHARIAPDGTVFGVTKTKNEEAWTITLTGSLFHGRFEGELSTAHANCRGFRTIDAILKPAAQT